MSEVLHDVEVPVRTWEGTEIPAPGAYALDAAHSHVGFTVRHLMVSKVRGQFSSLTGTVVIGDDPADSSVEVTIEAASIGTGDEQRDGHLRSPDFFDVERHPSITYRSTGVRASGAKGGGQWLVDGELTVLGVTRPVTLEVTFDGAAIDPWGNGRAAFSARAEINREDYGLTWNQALETGGVLVGKKVEIAIEAQAVRQG